MVLLTVHAAAALFMTGVVWFVQIVHYPLMHRVGGGSFPRYEAEHTRRTSPVVAPVMILELITGVWLVLSIPAQLPPAWLWANGAGLLVIWVSTFALQVPAHRLLADGYDAAAVQRLVAGNWIRTIAWSVRTLLLLILLVSVLQLVPEAAPTPTAPR